MERWKIEVELTFNPITISGSKETSTQALYRAKDALDKLLAEETGISHYHVLMRPTMCVEFD